MDNLTMSRDNLMTYLGPFSMKIISSIGKYVSDNSSSIQAKRINAYKVLIELTYNVYLYSLDRDKVNEELSIGRGKLILDTLGNGFRCTTINKVLDIHAPILIENCLNINSMDETELKTKRDNLRKEINLKDTGAHIGLIMIRLYSGNKIQYEIIKDEETNDYYFSISAMIND